jgi:hypothetical protein
MTASSRGEEAQGSSSIDARDEVSAGGVVYRFKEGHPAVLLIRDR